MKKIATLILLAFLTGNVTIAQYDEIEWGKLETSAKKSYYPDIIGEDENNIYVTADIGNDNVIEVYSKKGLGLSLEKTITPQKIDNNKCEIEKVVFLEGKYYVFVSYFDKKSKLSNMFVYMLDPKTGDKIGKEVKLFEVEIEKKGGRGSFNVVVSDDKTKILVNHASYIKKLKIYKDYYRLIDADLNILLEKEEEITYEDAKEYKSSYQKIDNDGSVFFIKEYKDDEDKFFIVSYNASQDYEKWEEEINMSKIEAKSNTALVSGITFTINANDELVLCGYYSEKLSQGTKKSGKEKKAKMEFVGNFFLAIDKKSKEVKFKKVNRFDEDFKNQFRTAKDEKKDKDSKIPNAFNSIELLTKADGGIILIGELYFYSHYSSDQGVSHHELFGDLIVLNLDAEGNLLWANRVPKKQVFWYRSQGALIVASTGVSGLVVPNWRTVEYFSYQAAITDDELIILFNDNVKNTATSDDMDKTKSLTKLKNAVITRYTIALKSGERKESLFMGGKDYQVYFKPMVSYQKNQGSDIYTFGIKGKKYKYGLLK